jgi:hypothetical protein
MKPLFTTLYILFTGLLLAQTTTVWNPAANEGSEGLWTTAANWTTNTVPGSDSKVVFNVPGAQNARLNSSSTIFQFVLGDGARGEALFVQDGGTLNTSSDIWSAIGWSDTSRLVVETGGTVSLGLHMWVGWLPGGLGIVEVNGGTLNVGAQTGLGWTDPNKTTAGIGQVYVNGGTLNLNELHPTQSIGPESFIQVGGGVVTIQGDQQGSVNAYIAASKIRGMDGGMLNVVFENGVTTITAAASRAETTVWDPANNPNSTGLWTEAENWSDDFVPNGNKVVFNVEDAQPAVVDDSVARVRQFVLGDGGPGTLTVANGGMLSTSPEIWSAVGWSDTARLIVETGGMVSFGQHMWVGFEPNGLGIVELNGGTINVGAQTGLGWTDPNKTNTGVGRVYVNSGTLNLSQLHPTQSIGPESFIQIGDGTVMIMGNQVAVTESYEAAGKITARDTDKTVVATFDTTTQMTLLTAELSTSVGATVIPGRMNLEPNFPNPFRQSTTIRYRLDEQVRVRLHVYNSNGQQVADLVNQTQPIGDYQVEWDAGNLPAGIYVVRLTSDRFSLARQMTLVR